MNFRPTEEEGEEENNEAIASPDASSMTLAAFLGDGTNPEIAGNDSAAAGDGSSAGLEANGGISNGKCRCEARPDVAEMVVRRYPLTRDDFNRKERRYSEVGGHGWGGIGGLGRREERHGSCCF